MSYDFISLTIAGLTLGFSSGISPGPLLALTISETLKFGIKTGLKVAAVPILTDAPIVAGSILILSELSDLNNMLAIISIVGAIFLLYFGIENLRIKLDDANLDKSKFSSVQKAIIANFLNPNPYLFWIAIGAPLFLGGINVSIWNGIIFIFTFYLMLVGSKMLIVFIGARMSTFFKSNKYLYIIRGTGILLIVLALLLFIDGIAKFNF